MLKYWRIPPSDRFLYRRRAEFITGVWENAAFAADTGLRRKERALTHSERQSGCRDGDFTSWSSIVLPFSPYYVKPLIILGPKEKGEEKRKMLFSPILHYGAGKIRCVPDSKPLITHANFILISRGFVGMPSFWDTRKLEGFLDGILFLSLLCGKSHGVRQKFA